MINFWKLSSLSTSIFIATPSFHQGQVFQILIHQYNINSKNIPFNIFLNYRMKNSTEFPAAKILNLEQRFIRNFLTLFKFFPYNKSKRKYFRVKSFKKEPASLTLQMQFSNPLHWIYHFRSNIIRIFSCLLLRELYNAELKILIIWYSR